MSESVRFDEAHLESLENKDQVIELAFLLYTARNNVLLVLTEADVTEVIDAVLDEIAKISHSIELDENVKLDSHARDLVPKGLIAKSTNIKAPFKLRSKFSQLSPAVAGYRADEESIVIASALTSVKRRARDAATKRLVDELPSVRQIIREKRLAKLDQEKRTRAAEYEPQLQAARSSLEPFAAHGFVSKIDEQFIESDNGFSVLLQAETIDRQIDITGKGVAKEEALTKAYEALYKKLKNFYGGRLAQKTANPE